jgi:hypothetical protein
MNENGEIRNLFIFIVIIYDYDLRAGRNPRAL